MRIDPKHTEKIANAVTHDENGDRNFNIDIAFAMSAFERLTLWERGLLPSAIGRAIKAKRPTPEQRLILALFAHVAQSEGEHV